MTHYVAHDLSPELARKALTQAAQYYTEKYKQYGCTMSWISESCMEMTTLVKGAKLSATLTLDPKRIGLDMQVPFLLRPLRGKAMNIMEKSIAEWIAKAKRGNLEAGS